MKQIEKQTNNNNNNIQKQQQQQQKLAHRGNHIIPRRNTEYVQTDNNKYFNMPSMSVTVLWE